MMTCRQDTNSKDVNTFMPEQEQIRKKPGETKLPILRLPILERAFKGNLIVYQACNKFSRVRFI